MIQWTIREMAEYLSRNTEDDWVSAVGRDDGTMVNALVQAVLAENPADDEPWGPLGATYRLPCGRTLTVELFDDPLEPDLKSRVMVRSDTYEYAELLRNPTKGQVRKLVALLDAREV